MAELVIRETPETRAPLRHAELVSASIPETADRVEKWTLKRVQGDGGPVVERVFIPHTRDHRALLRHAELGSASIAETAARVGKWTLKQVQGDGGAGG